MIQEKRTPAAAADDERFMGEAVRLSRLAAEHGSEPFGAVLVKDGGIVYSNENQIYSQSDPTFHAELGLIRRFCHEKRIMNLRDYTLYTSCEPCFMCCGAMVWAKLGRLVYAAGARDLASIFGSEGCDCSALVFANSGHRPQVTAGVLRQESFAILKDYFGKFRK